MKSHILVTGATGFLGYNIIKKLSAINNIIALVRYDSDISKIEKLDNVIIRYEVTPQ